MALTLKLKVPAGDTSSGTRSPRKPAIASVSNVQPVPKIRIKPPAAESPKRSKTGSDSKHKKLKISLGKNSVLAAPPPRPVRNVPRVRVKPTRIPGEGYDSEAPGIEDDMLLEQGIAVRFLDDANLDFVQQAVESGDLSAVNLKWITREKAVFNINGTFYSARLVDLPTVTELYKTMDKKNIFKTIDVCQLLLVLKAINPADLDTDKDFEVPPEFTYVHPLYKLLSKGEIKPRHTLVRDGLTSPFVNVFRRFRPRKTSHRVLEDIDARVRELIKLDDDAEESHFELVDESTVTSRFKPAHAALGPGPTSMSQVSSMDSRMDPNTMLGNEYGADQTEGEGELDGDDIEMHLEEELNEVFGDEDEDGIEDGLNAVMNGGDIAEEEEEDDEEEEEDDDEDEDEDEDDEESKADRQHAKLLENEIAELEKVVAYHKKNLSNATSKMMRMKFQNTYSSLKASLDQKKRTLAKHKDEQDQLMKMQDPAKMHAPRVESEEDDDDDDDDDDADVNDKEQNTGASDHDTDNKTDKLDDLDDLF